MSDLRNKRWAVILAVMVLVPGFAREAGAAVITIGSAKDTTIYASNVNNSAGGATVVFSGTDGNSSPKRGLMAFDIADNVPVGATIISVQLALTLGQVAGNLTTGTATIGLRRLSADWGEGTTGAGTTISQDGQGLPANSGDATWANRFSPSTAWTSAGGDFAPSASATTVVGTTVNSSYTWMSTPAMVADVQGWLNNPSTNFGWLLLNGDETDAKTFRAFYSHEAANPSLQPSLTVTFTAVPEPAALSLGAMLALMLMRRSRTSVV